MILSPLLREAIYWIAAALCVVGEIAIMRSMFRCSRVSPADRSSGVDAGLPRVRPMAELIWAFLPAVTLVIILLLTLGAIR